MISIITTALALVKQGFGGHAPQQAKCKKCYDCPACYYPLEPIFAYAKTHYVKEG